MIRTYEATIDEKGNIRFLTPARLVAGRRVLVTILDEPAAKSGETALLSEEPIIDWNRSEDDTPWLRLSTQGLSTAYGGSEPDYPLTAIKEPNPAYEGG